VKLRTSAQAADVPLDDDAEDDGEEEEAAADEDADDFESDPVEEVDEVEPVAFADDDAGALLDEEPRLSFR
jgi:hypothetical protein